MLPLSASIGHHRDAQDDVISMVDVRTSKIVHTTPFRYEVNEISWNLSGEYFFLTCGNNGEGILEVMRFDADGSTKALRSVRSRRVLLPCGTL